MKTMKQTVKETVDFVYSYLSPHANGISFNQKQMGRGYSRRAISLLVKLGIIEKGCRAIDGNYSYKWVATMGPTKTLYDSISAELRDENNRYNKVCLKKAKRAKKKKSAEIVVDEPVINDLAEKTLGQRLNELYPVFDFDDEMAALFRRCGYGEDEIALAKSRRTAMNTINARLREAYMLGRKEKEAYE